MATRARINVVEDGEILVSIFHMYDGYPTHVGQKIKDILGNAVEEANGIGCLAATLNKGLKDRVGNVYIRNTSADDHGESYIYNLNMGEPLHAGDLMIEVHKDDGSVLYDGRLDKFDAVLAEALGRGEVTNE